MEAGGGQHAARQAIASFLDSQTPFHAELWLSALLGECWTAGVPGSPQRGMETASPLLRAIAQDGTPGALGLLDGFAALGTDGAGELAGRLAGELRARGVAADGPTIAHPDILGLQALSEPDDRGLVLLVEARHAGMDAHTLMAFVDFDLRGMVTHLVPHGPAAEVVAKLEAQGFRATESAPGEAIGRLVTGIEAYGTTARPSPEEFVACRALGLRRAAQLPGVAADVSEPGLTEDARERLLADFLASPEGTGLDDVDEAVVDWAIDYACDEQLGGPLRWTAAGVERFMLDWLPRTVRPGRRLIEAVPTALPAWLRYSARRRDVDAERLVAAVERCRVELLGRE